MTFVKMGKVTCYCFRYSIRKDFFLKCSLHDVMVQLEIGGKVIDVSSTLMCVTHSGKMCHLVAV